MNATDGQPATTGAIDEAHLVPYRNSVLSSSLEIRVAAIQPYKYHPDEVVCFEFENVRIDDAGHREYAALSYAWEQQNLDELISCNGSGVKITKNLLFALRKIRHSDHIVHVWADAICINQSSLEERKQQVSIMDRIFAEASQVLVYLGDLSAEQLQGAAMIIKFSQVDFTQLDVTKNNSLGEVHAYLANAMKEAALPELDSELWACLGDIMGRPWFTRLWIIQEYAVARKISFIIGNNDFMDAEVFRLGCLSAFWYYRVLSLPLLEKLINKGFTAAETIGMWIPRYSLLKGYYIPMAQTQKQMSQFKGLAWACNRFEQITRFREGYQETQKQTASKFKLKHDRCGLNINWSVAFGKPWWAAQRYRLFDNYLKTRDFKCTEIRDRVYAIRGLCTEIGIPELAVDYENPSWQLAERVSIHMIRRGHGNFLLTAMSLCAQPNQHGWRVSLREDKPSSIDQLPKLINRLGTFEKDMYRAGGYEEQIEVLSDGISGRASIGVAGIRVSRLVNVCDIQLPELVQQMVYDRKSHEWTSWWVGMKMQIKWYKDAVHWLSRMEGWMRSFEDKPASFEIDCWRSLCCGLTYNAIGQREVIGSKPNQVDPGAVILECKQAYSSIWSLVWRFMHRNVALPWEHILTGCNLQLAIDSDGRICAVPVGSAPGDLVCVFKGFSLPFVLRSATDEPYQLLGVAYVQGIMNGDLFENTYRTALETFVLDPGPASEES